MVSCFGTLRGLKRIQLPKHSEKEKQWRGGLSQS